MTLSNNKRVQIVGVPIDLGSNPLGVKMGASALRSAGLEDALRYNNIEFTDNGDIQVKNEIRDDRNVMINEIARISNELCEIVEASIRKEYIPVILGGDHSASIGSIAGAAKSVKNLGLLWLDCHPDVNTPQSSMTGNVHGMTVAISLGTGYPVLVNCGDFSPKLQPQNICMLGTKDIDSGERKYIFENKIKMFTIFDIVKYGIVHIMNMAFEEIFKDCDGIHLSFDVDVLDPLIAPGTGIASKGGLNYREIAYIMNYIGHLNIVRSIDIIEINPLRDVRNQTSELAIELLLSALGGSYGDYERHYMNDFRA